MRQIKVLLIAPYEAMREVAQSVAAAHEEIEMTILVGNMDEGKELVRSCDQSQYDVIISRGGTAARIREVASIPVIEIQLTPYDIQNALASISGTQKKVAIAGSPGIVGAAASLCDLLNIEMRIVTIRDDAEAKIRLPELKKQGFELILCDMVGLEAAPEAELDTVLITSGVKGIEDALNKTIRQFSGRGRTSLADVMLHAELLAKGESIAVLNQAGLPLLVIPEPSLAPALRSMLVRMLPAVLEEGEVTVKRPLGVRNYRIEARTVAWNGEQCVAFRLHNDGPKLPVTTPGLRLYDSSERDMTRVSRHYGGKKAAILERAEKAAESGLPVIVCGEKGTLPDSVAGCICMHDVLAEQDCCVLDCPKIGAKGWNKLYGSSGLLAFRPGSTVLLDHVLELPDTALETLLDFICETDLTGRLRFVFCMTTGIYPAREKKIIRQIAETLYAVVLDLPAIREKKEDIPVMLDSMLTWLCAEMGIRVPRIEEKGREALCGYRWPRNYPQFHRVLTQLLTDCGTGIITEEKVRDILLREDESIPFRTADDTIDLNGTMEEITHRIVKKILAEEGMNKSRTAKRLGISRATLWRILGKED